MSMKLLIYEDDQSQASQLANLFGSFGFKTLMASTDSEVQEIISNNAIDLFIVRAEVRAQGGYMLIKNLRKMSRYASVPILLISSKGTDTIFEKHKNLEFAASAYLRIPAADEMILAVSNDILPFLTDDSDDVADSSVDDSELNELKDAITALSTVNEELTEDAAKLETRIKELNADLEASAKLKPVEDENKKVSALEQKIAESRLEIDDLEQKVEDLESVSSTNDASDKKMKEMQMKWGESQKKVEDLQKELKALIADKDKMVGAGEIEKMQAQLEKERVAKENIANSLNTLEEERDAFSKKCDELKSQITTMENESSGGDDEEMVALRDKLQEQQDTNEDLHLINREMKDKVRRATTEVDQMKRESEKSTEAKDEAQKRLGEIEAARATELEELTKEKDAKIEELTKEKNAKIEELTKEKEDAISTIQSEQKSKMRVLEDRFADAVSERDRVEIELATYEQRLAESIGVQAEQTAKIEEFEESVSGFGKEIEELTEKASQLAKREEELTETTTQLKTMTDRYTSSQEKAKSFGETIDRLNEKVELLDSMSVELEAVKEKARKLDDAVSQIEMYEDAQEKAEKTEAELNDDKTKLQEQLTALEEKMSDKSEVLNTIAEALQRLEK
ncbi:hypothetical protein KAH37_04615 [bacterium]|nr:hypothetical protein [bacterium]